MNQNLANEVANEMIEVAKKIKAGNCNITEEDAIDIMSVIAHQAMSKGEACNYLNVSRSKFGNMVSNKELPKGRKKKWWTELVWYKDELWQRIRHLTT